MTRPFHAIHYAAPAPGPRFIVLGAVHGNETCGTRAIRRVVDEIESGSLALRTGELTLVPITNPLAHERGTRQGERNLNRKLEPRADPREYEDHVANWLCPLLARHEVLLDLHSFHTPGEPFVMVGPDNNAGALEPFAHAADEEALALRLGVRRIVDGWLGTYAAGVERRRQGGGDHDAHYGIGTTEFMRRVGGWGFTLECGQHDDPQAPEVAYRAVRRALAHLGMTAGPLPERAPEVEALRLFEVVDKVHADDRFVRPWSSFDALCAGDVIGERADGTPVEAPCDARIVFPNPAAGAGQEWYYLARGCDRFEGRR
jgi:predicted deacylase